MESRYHLEATGFEAIPPDYKLNLSRDTHSVSTVPETLTEVSPTALGCRCKIKGSNRKDQDTQLH